jgi:hypothetical protein
MFFLPLIQICKNLFIMLIKAMNLEENAYENEINKYYRI